MLTSIILFLLGLFVSDGEADALRSTAPTYLTAETAREHLVAARIAAAEYGVDANLVLSMAHHETHYDQREHTNEPGGKISCGVMTPEPMHPSLAKLRCAEVASSLIASYLAGAQHLRGWIDGPTSPCHGNMRCALIGVAGGFVGLRHCAIRENQRTDYRCSTHLVFQHRARMIRKALASAVANRSDS